MLAARGTIGLLEGRMHRTSTRHPHRCGSDWGLSWAFGPRFVAYYYYYIITTTINIITNFIFIINVLMLFIVSFSLNE